MLMATPVRARAGPPRRDRRAGCRRRLFAATQASFASWLRRDRVAHT